jgi:hypothetical protein
MPETKANEMPGRVRSALNVWRRVANQFGGIGYMFRGLVNSFGMVTTLPGLCVRLTLRILLARACGGSVKHRDLNFTYGGVPRLDGVQPGWRSALVLLAPAYLLVAFGALFALPVVLESVFFEVDIRPNELNEDGLQRLVVEQSVFRGPIQALSLWSALSCWWAAAIDKRDADQALKEMNRLHSRALRTVCGAFGWPPLVLASVFGPIDRYLLVASGLFSVGTWGILTVLLTRALVG